MDKQTKRCVQVKETEPKEKADVKNISKISKSQNLTRSLKNAWKLHQNSYTKNSTIQNSEVLSYVTTATLSTNLWTENCHFYATSESANRCQGNYLSS